MSDYTQIEEGSQTDIEVLATDVELSHFASELYIGIGKAVCQDTVAHDTAQGVSTSQSFVHHALDEEGVEVGVHIEWRTTCDIILCTNTIRESHAVAVDRHIMTESKIELQVVVPRCSLLSVLRIKCRRIRKERISIDALGRASTLVAAVVGQTCTQIGVPASQCLVLIDKSPLHIFLVKTFHIRIECLLCMVLGSRIKSILLTIEHVNITLANHIAKHTKTCIPLDILPNGTLNIRSKTEEIAFVFIERARLVVLQRTHLCRVFFPLMEILVVDGLIAIEAIEVAHRIGLIGGIQC